jgi:hypothetical protein
MKTVTMLKGAVGRRMIRSFNTYIMIIPAQIKLIFIASLSPTENLKMKLQLQVISSEFKQYGETWHICLITADNTDTKLEVWYAH